MVLQNLAFRKKIGIPQIVLQWTLDITNLQRNVKKLGISGICYIERLYKALLSKGGQTLVRYIESSYYQGFVLSIAHCI